MIGACRIPKLLPGVASDENAWNSLNTRPSIPVESIRDYDCIFDPVSQYLHRTDGWYFRLLDVCEGN